MGVGDSNGAAILILGFNGTIEMVLALDTAMEI